MIMKTVPKSYAQAKGEVSINSIDTEIHTIYYVDILFNVYS